MPRRDVDRRIATLLIGMLVTFLLALLASPALGAVTAADDDALLLAQDEGEQAFTGRLLGPDGNALQDVTIRAVVDGEVVGQASTDEAGDWRIAVPEGGSYTIELDTTSLPEGVTLRDEALASREFEVDAGGSQGVLFATVAGEGGGGASTLARFLQLSVEGLKVGAIIAITSVGLSLIFGVTGLVNFAHGELVAIGAAVAYSIHVAGDGTVRVPLVLAAVAAMLIGAALGGGLDRFVFRPLRRANTGLISMLVITIGLSFGLRYGLQIVFGAGSRKYIDYAVQTDPLTLGPVEITPRDLGVILISLLLLGAVGLMLSKTRLGTAMRAVADNRDLAESSGIDVKRVVLAVWVLGGGLAAIGGVFQGLSTAGVQFDMGFRLLLLMFAGVIVGGIGTAYGAMLGGLLVGLASEVSTLVLSVELKLVFAFLLLIAVLMVKPTGLLGTRERFG